jgi:hypothetical protein
MGIFKNSRVYVLATVAYTGSFLFGKTNLSFMAIKYSMLIYFPKRI